MNVITPIVTIYYNGKNITADISDMLISVVYDDYTEGKSDELTIVLDDSKHLWKMEWYPSKGDKLQCAIGYGSVLMDCGVFEIDEIESNFPPDTFTIRALAVGINSSIRTKKNKGYDNQTLLQIAQDVASRNNLELQSGVTTSTVPVSYVKQREELDTAVRLMDNALSRADTPEAIPSILAEAANYLTSVAGAIQSKFVFESSDLRDLAERITTFGSLYKGISVLPATINQAKQALSDGKALVASIKVKLVEATAVVSTPSPLANIKLVRVTQHQESDLAFLFRVGQQYGIIFSIRGNKLTFTSMYELESGEPVLSIDRSEMMNGSFKDKTSDTYKTVRVRYKNPADNKVVESEVNDAGLGFETYTADDALEIRVKAEDKTQADAIAKAALYNANSRLVTGNCTVPGHPMLVGGNSVEFTGLGVYSGKFHIKHSSHRIVKAEAYTVALDVKKIATVPLDKQRPKTVNPKYKPSVNSGGGTPLTTFNIPYN